MNSKTDQFELKNGIRIFYIKSESKSSGMGIAVPSGIYWEKPEEAGTAHLVEHLLSRLEVYDGKDMREAVYENGGVYDASTNNLFTFFYLYSLNEDLSKSSETLIKGIFYPNFRSGALEKSKESVVSEMAASQKLVSYDVIRQMMWKDTKLKKPLLGEKEILLSLNLDQVKKYHRERYFEGGISVVVIGPKFPDNLKGLLSEIEINKTSQNQRVLVKTESPGYRIFEEGNTHSTLTFAFPTIGFRDVEEEKYLFRLAASLLSDVYISELEKYGLIYKNSWVWNALPDAGEFILELPELDPEHTFSVLRIALSLFENWTDLKVSKSEFENVKKQRMLAVSLSEDLDEILPVLTRDFCVSNNAHTPNQAIEIYKNADLKNTLRTASKFLLTTKPYLVVSLGNDSLKFSSEIRKLLDEYYLR